MAHVEKFARGEELVRADLPFPSADVVRTSVYWAIALCDAIREVVYAKAWARQRHYEQRTCPMNVRVKNDDEQEYAWKRVRELVNRGYVVYWLSNREVRREDEHPLSHNPWAIDGDGLWLIHIYIYQFTPREPEIEELQRLGARVVTSDDRTETYLDACKRPRIHS